MGATRRAFSSPQIAQPRCASRSRPVKPSSLWWTNPESMWLDPGLKSSPGRVRGDTMLKGFRDFIMRGNVVDLAVAVVIGAAFKAVIDAVVADIITPVVAAIGGKQDFSALYFTVNGSKFKYGDLINQVISFLIVAAAIYFLVVLPLNKL